MVLIVPYNILTAVPMSGNGSVALSKRHLIRKKAVAQSESSHLISVPPIETCVFSKVSFQSIPTSFRQKVGSDPILA